MVALDAGRHHVDGDSMRLHQVLWNLVRNAIKFTPEGGRIEISSWNVGDDLAIEVADDGRGFDPAAAPRLFTPFEQGQAAADRSGNQTGGGGLGLGLAICQGLVQLHGGELTAASPGPGRGARFVVRLATVAAPLPAARPAQESGRPAPAAVAGVAASKPRILLVEDHPDTAALLLELLDECGYEAQGANSVRQALASDLDHVDLVLSDIGLPDGTGLDLMRQLAERRGGSIKGIALSGYGTEADRAASKEAGFSAHLTKPVDWSSLIAAINEVSKGPS
jgi:two-component system CheB/CheR fusion protein